MRKIILILGLLAAIPVPAGATTFAAFPVTQQIEQAQVVVRGRVSSVTTKIEPTSQRPYTYWTLSVQETYAGESVGSQLVVRQPGGEVGDLGYRVPGAADFREGEDVIVVARSTNEEARELIGLASGKYTVHKREDGRETLENGLGISVAGADGQALSPEQFRALVQRVVNRSASPEDEKVVIDPAQVRSAQHAHAAPEGIPDQVNKSNTNASIQSGATERQPATPEKSLGGEVENSDRQIASQGGVRWLGVFVAAIFFVSFGGLFVLLTRKKRA